MAGYGATLPYGQGLYKGEFQGNTSFKVNRIDKLTGVVLRYAVKPDQGVGWNLNEGDNQVFPEPNIKPFAIYDENNHSRQVVIDEKTGKFYEISTRTGPTDSGLVKTYLDKKDSYGGSEIPATIKLKEHRADQEHKQIEHIESHAYFRPQDEIQGFRPDFGASLDVFIDGDQNIAAGHTENFPLNGHLVVQKRLEGNRMQIQLKTTTSQFRLVRTNQYYIQKDKALTTRSAEVTEATLQEEFATPFLWLSRGRTLVVNRATAVNVGGSIFGSVTGPDGLDDSAMSISPADGLSEAIGNLTGDFSFVLWIGGIVTFPVIVLDLPTGTLQISLTSTAGVVALRFNDGTDDFSQNLSWDGLGFVALKITRNGSSLIISEEGVLVNTLTLTAIRTYGGTMLILGGTAAGDPFDVRGYRSVISEAAFKYLVDDVRNNEGNALLPLF